jgi:hypothetical protein
MPRTTTVTVDTLEGVTLWASQNVSAEVQTRIRAIIELHGRAKAKQFADQPTLWEIDWFYRGAGREFYRLALVNTETSRELWGSS